MKGISRQQKAATFTTMLLTSVFFQAKSVIAAPILDQSFDASAGGLSQAVFSGQELAQTFTVGLDGYLDTVGLMLNRQSATTSGDFTLNIFSTTSGTPDEAGTLFFSQSYSVFDLPGTGPFSTHSQTSILQAQILPFLQVMFSPYRSRIVVVTIIG